MKHPTLSRGCVPLFCVRDACDRGACDRGACDRGACDRGACDRASVRDRDHYDHGRDHPHLNDNVRHRCAEL